MCLHGCWEFSSQMCSLVIANLSHKLAHAYSKWQYLYCRKQFLCCHKFTNQMSVSFQDFLSDQLWPKCIAKANYCCSEHLLIPVLWAAISLLFISHTPEFFLICPYFQLGNNMCPVPKLFPFKYGFPSALAGVVIVSFKCCSVVELTPRSIPNPKLNSNINK